MKIIRQILVGGFVLGGLISTNAFAEERLSKDAPAETFLESVGETLDPTGASVEDGLKISGSVDDHEARIFDVFGSVKIMKSGMTDWISAQKNVVIKEGDQLLTGENSWVDIAYDESLLNLARIDAQTRAEFFKIEPTVLKLEDGTIYNALDGLPKGSSYQVSTPVAVAAVRGTHFEVNYAADTQTFFAAALPTPEDAHESLIELIQINPDGTLGPGMELGEGLQVQLTESEILDSQMAAPLDPKILEQAKHKFENQMPRNDFQRPMEGPSHRELQDRLTLPPEIFKPPVNPVEDIIRDETQENNLPPPLLPPPPLPPDNQEGEGGAVTQGS